VFGLLDSVASLAKDVSDIATAPVKIAVDATRVVTEPMAEMARDVADVFKPYEGD